MRTRTDERGVALITVLIAMMIMVAWPSRC